LNIVKSWKLHAGWAFVTVLAVAVTARICRPLSPEPPPVLLRSVAGPVPVETPPPPVRPAAEILPEPPVEAPAPNGSKTTNQALADKIRAMLKTNDFDELRDLMAGIDDRAFKLALLKEALEGQDEQAVYTALFVLRSMKGRDAAGMIEAHLAAHLSDRTDRTAWVAAYSLGELGDAGSIAPLQEALRLGSEEVRVYSAKALMMMGLREPADQMLAGFAREYESADGSLRRKAIERIMKLSPEGAVPILTRALKDSNGDVRQMALHAFNSIGKPEYLPLLQPLTEDPNPDVARRAQETIEVLKSHP